MNITELTQKRPKSEQPLYRLNFDALLCFDAKQSFQDAELYPAGVVDMLVLEDWEAFPPLANGPRIIRIRPIQRWGVVFEWPLVYEVTSLLAAYMFLKQELTRRGKPLELVVPSNNPALASKRRKLE